MGPSGTGKSHSLQYLDPTKTVIICPDRKELPFKGSRKIYKTVFKEDGISPLYSKSNFIEINNMKEIRSMVSMIATRRLDIKVIVIDTITYAMIESVMREIKTKGYDKFTEFAEELYGMINDAAGLRKDLHIFFMAHVDVDIVDGTAMYSFKIPAGKLTKEKIVPEGLFTTVLYSECVMVDGKPTYSFRTQNSGNDTCKSPEAMFPSLRIQNDLQYVIDCMDAYHNDEAPPKAKVVQIDESNQF